MQLTTLIQYILPHHLLSRLIGKLAASNLVWLKNFLIDCFIKHYKIDMSSAIETNPHSYPNFNSLFTRALRPEARPIDNDQQTIISPVDARISQFGTIDKDQLIQAKGFTFDLSTLLSNKLKTYSDKLTNGHFITLYLSPSDYHRIHMPLDGKLLAMVHIPGKLFSVNNSTINNIPQVFTRNERIAVIFETILGPIAVVMVGAMLVASITVPWEKIPTPAKTIPNGFQVLTRRKRRRAPECTPCYMRSESSLQQSQNLKGEGYMTYWDYTQQSINIKRGSEIGQFQFGSTVILIFPHQTTKLLESLHINSLVKVGEKLAVIT